MHKLYSIFIFTITCGEAGADEIRSFNVYVNWPGSCGSSGESTCTAAPWCCFTHILPQSSLAQQSQWTKRWGSKLSGIVVIVCRTFLTSNPSNMTCATSALCNCTNFLISSHSFVTGASRDRCKILSTSCSGSQEQLLSLQAAALFTQIALHKSTLLLWQ